jgi:hypothetical protein
MLLYSVPPLAENHWIFQIEESTIRLQVARARKGVQLAQKRLAESRLLETRLHLRINKFRVAKAEDELGATELEIGRLRLLARRKCRAASLGHGLQHPFKPTKKGIICQLILFRD